MPNIQPCTVNPVKELLHMSQTEIGEQLGNEQQENNPSGVTSDNNPLR